VTASFECKVPFIKVTFDIVGGIDNEMVFPCADVYMFYDMSISDKSMVAKQ
jgi:hypothetical protein